MPFAGGASSPAKLVLTDQMQHGEKSLVKSVLIWRSFLPG